MRLLIITQAVDQDDPTLGFFHRWIEEFARHCEHVYVVCLFEGAHTLPRNVTVLSLGKETGDKNAGGIFLARFRYLYRFFAYVWTYRRDYDVVFVHMNQIYVLLGGLFWRLWQKRICLWYAHGAVSRSLRLAEKMTSHVVTASTASFRLQSRKVCVTGHGIDMAQFTPCADTYQHDRIRILYIGRIARVKQCEVLIDAVVLLRARGQRFSLTLVGGIGVPSDQLYRTSLQERVQRYDMEKAVLFVGGVSHDKIQSYLCSADVCVNPSRTGSLDKVSLESLAVGVPVVTCNVAFPEVFGMYAERLMFPTGDATALADRIVALHHAPDRREMVNVLAGKVRREHSLEALVPRILSVMDGISV